MTDWDRRRTVSAEDGPAGRGRSGRRCADGRGRKGAAAPISSAQPGPAGSASASGASGLCRAGARRLWPSLRRLLPSLRTLRSPPRGSLSGCPYGRGAEAEPLGGAGRAPAVGPGLGGRGGRGDGTGAGGGGRGGPPDPGRARGGRRRGGHPHLHSPRGPRCLRSRAVVAT